MQQILLHCDMLGMKHWQILSPLWEKGEEQTGASQHQGDFSGAQKKSYQGYFRDSMTWFGVEKTCKAHPVQPLQRAGTPPTVPACSEPVQPGALDTSRDPGAFPTSLPLLPHSHECKVWRYHINISSVTRIKPSEVPPPCPRSRQVSLPTATNVGRTAGQPPAPSWNLRQDLKCFPLSKTTESDDHPTTQLSATSPPPTSEALGFPMWLQRTTPTTPTGRIQRNREFFTKLETDGPCWRR